MLAAERTSPCWTTAGTVTPTAVFSSMCSLKCSTSCATTSITASGVAGFGVRIFLRFVVHSPLLSSTTAPLMPLPPMSMPSATWCFAMVVRLRLLVGEVSEVWQSSCPSRQGQDLVPVVGDEDGVLELRGPLAVCGHDRPAVVPHLPVRGAEVEHR